MLKSKSKMAKIKSKKVTIKSKKNLRRIRMMIWKMWWVTMRVSQLRTHSLFK
jgi:hypothetical protein